MTIVLSPFLNVAHHSHCVFIAQMCVLLKQQEQKDIKRETR